MYSASFEGVELNWITKDSGRVAVGADEVILALDGEVRHVSRYVKQVFPDYKFQWSAKKTGRPRWYVYEPGVYQLLFSSPLAVVAPEKIERFQRWVFERVLPDIRRDNVYISPTITKPQAIAAIARLDRILDTPSPWERMYDPKACEKAFKWYGADFYWKYCYSWLTTEERCKLERVNPVKNGDREHRIHQDIEPETKTRLTPHLTRLVDFLISSTSKQDFETRMGRVFGCDQLELL